MDFISQCDPKRKIKKNCAFASIHTQNAVWKQKRVWKGSVAHGIKRVLHIQQQQNLNRNAQRLVIVFFLSFVSSFSLFRASQASMRNWNTQNAQHVGSIDNGNPFNESRTQKKNRKKKINQRINKKTHNEVEKKKIISHHTNTNIKTMKSISMRNIGRWLMKNVQNSNKNNTTKWKYPPEKKNNNQRRMKQQWKSNNIWRAKKKVKRTNNHLMWIWIYFYVLKERKKFVVFSFFF